jgi:ankyrin repeat protein
MDQVQNLIEAAQAGDVPAVRRLLDQGADPNCRDDHGLTPLSVSSFEGMRDVVVVLIAAGANIHAQDTFGRTALHHAAVGGHTPTTVRLLMNGADPRATYGGGKSCVMLASLAGHDTLAQLLRLASRADLNGVRILAQSVSARPAHPTDRGSTHCEGASERTRRRRQARAARNRLPAGDAD